jgi:hypothetical protein
MHIRRNINGQGLVQFELVQMSTFNTDMACFGYEMYIFLFFFLRARAKCPARLAVVTALANNTNKHSRLHVYGA